MRVSSSNLVAIASEILIRLGESPGNAEIAAASLIQADARGVSTHGINLLRMVADRVNAGMLALPTRVSILSDDCATMTLDGHDGLGPVAARLCLDHAMAKAREFGVGMVTLRNTNNIGALGCISMVAAKEGYITITTTNGNPSMAPFGAAEPFFGSNPLSIAVPRGTADPLVLDMSSSVVARGKIRLAALSGRSIPEGWALDAAGQPTSDPKQALKGCLLPMAGPKGSGLAMMIDILSGLLSGSSYGRQLKSFHELSGPTGVGAAFICIDVGRFIDKAVFSNLLEEYCQEIKNLRRQPGFDDILVPGELELGYERDGAINGIEVPEAVVAAIDQILASLGSSVRLAGSRP
jgi:LDH2 family malate/lactate/ureidoglycolate dehydrogenase